MAGFDYGENLRPGPQASSLPKQPHGERNYKDAPPQWEGERYLDGAHLQGFG